MARRRGDDEEAKDRLVERDLTALAREGKLRPAYGLDEVLERLAEVPRTIVYVRDLAVGVGGPTMPVMIRALRAGSLRFVLEADLRRAQELLRSDETMGERLHLLPVHEPPPDRVRWILAKVAEDLEKEHLVPFEPAAIDLAFRLAAKFLVAQRMPRKAIEL